LAHGIIAIFRDMPVAVNRLNDLAHLVVDLLPDAFIPSRSSTSRPII
jgi:hypothetical protein